MMKPYYKYGDTGVSGRSFWFIRLFFLFAIGCGDKQTLPRGDKMQNPHRELQYGGTTLGFRGKNYWFSDNTLLGWIIKKLFT